MSLDSKLFSYIQLNKNPCRLKLKILKLVSISPSFCLFLLPQVGLEEGGGGASILPRGLASIIVFE